jgi:hypothetical protein
MIFHKRSTKKSGRPILSICVGIGGGIRIGRPIFGWIEFFDPLHDVVHLLGDLVDFSLDGRLVKVFHGASPVYGVALRETTTSGNRWFQRRLASAAVELSQRDRGLQAKVGKLLIYKYIKHTLAGTANIAAPPDIGRVEQAQGGNSVDCRPFPRR